MIVTEVGKLAADKMINIFKKPSNRQIQKKIMIMVIQLLRKYRNLINKAKKEVKKK